MQAVKFTPGEVEKILAAVSSDLQVDGYYVLREEINLRCTATSPEGVWRAPLEAAIKQLGYRLRVTQRGDSIYLSVFTAGSRVPWLNIVLFIVTVATVTVVPGWILEGNKFFHDSSLIVKWLYFSVPLMLILTVHEFGHYLAARRRGVRATLPYFIPSPTIIGTFGAFIKMKSAIPTRRDLIELGAAGPIAGFLLAVIVLAIGLAHVTYTAIPEGLETKELIDPLILKIVSFLVQSNPAPAGQTINLLDNQMLYAAWVGLVVTALNLLPVGQLDGGHIVYALFPRHHRFVSQLVFLGLLGAGFLWAGWWLWAALLYFIIRFGHPPTLDDAVPLTRGTKLLGWAGIIVFILTFTPVPF
jgi:membrane-associated protease RseP (regulator of RpoE activity)